VWGNPSISFSTASLAIMKVILARTFAICIFIVLSGCTFTLPPVTTASVERHQNGQPLQAFELKATQIQTLSGWFTQHTSGWSSSVVSYVPALVVRAKHANGEVSVINVLSKSVVIYNSTVQYEQQFKETDLTALRSILVAP
jgi:hypothetical protein